MANPRGIFTLRNLVLQKKLGEAVPNSEVFITTVGDTPIGPNAGYFYGGYVPSPMPDPGPKSIVGKIDFSADTAARVPSADLTDIGYSFSGNLPNRTHLYIIGGRIGTPGALGDGCQKLTYASDTTVAVPGGALSAASYQSASVYNGGVAGYMVGGSNPSFTSEIQKFEYASETASTITDQIPVARNRMASIGSVDAGYIFGGNPGATSEFIKFEYSTESISPIPARTPGGSAGYPVAQDGGGVSNTTTGYYMPGYFLQSEMSKFTFSTENPALLPGVGFTPGSGRPSTSGNTTQGYFALPSGPSASPETTIHKMNYSTDGLSPIPGTSTVAGRREGGGGGARSFSIPGQPSPVPIIYQFKTGITQGPNNGYSTGGIIQTPTPQTSVSTVDKLDFATDTSSITTALSTGSRNYGTGVSNTTTGYVCQGRPDLTATDLSSVDKYTFSTDTSARGPSDTVLGNRSAGSFGNNDAGYLTGGNTPAESSATEKVTYSTDGIARVPSADLNQKAYWIAGFGNSDAGYAAGGWTPGSTSRIEKMSYGTETYSTLPTTLGGGPRGALSAVKYGASAFSNNDTGFISGGAPFPSANTHTSTDKFVFSTDTCSRLPGADLLAARAYLQGMNNSGVGYQPGGTTGSDHISTVEKMSFSTETYSINPGSNLSQGRYSMQTISGRMLDLPQQPSPTPTPQTAPVPGPAPETGYWGAGQPHHTAVDKITYSNDTTARVPTADLNTPATYVSATGNGAAGYFAGGSSGGSITNVDKLSYSVDTASLVPGAFLTQNRYGLGAVANSTHGYFSGGTVDPATSSKTDRLTFSTDTTSEVPGAALSVGRFYTTATGNTTAGYIGGGFAPSASPTRVTTVDKLTYSTDTTAQVPGASLSTNLRGAGAAGNADAGYFSGGQDTTPSYISTTDKITYSNDTRSTVPGAALSVPRNSLAGVSNPSSGYFSGGSPGPISTTDKLNFSDDTRSTVATAKLSAARTELGGCSARSNALPSVAGIPSPVIC